jgi:hypothetical protein
MVENLDSPGAMGTILSGVLVHILYRYLKTREILSLLAGGRNLSYYRGLVDKLVEAVLAAGDGTEEIARVPVVVEAVY